MSKEQAHPKEIDPQILAAYTQTFINRLDLYPIQLPGGSYVSVAKTLTDNMIYAHLRGHITIGVGSDMRLSRTSGREDGREQNILN